MNNLLEEFFVVEKPDPIVLAVRSLLISITCETYFRCTFGTSLALSESLRIKITQRERPQNFSFESIYTFRGEEALVYTGEGVIFRTYSTEGRLGTVTARISFDSIISGNKALPYDANLLSKAWRGDFSAAYLPEKNIDQYGDKFGFFENYPIDEERLQMFL